MATKKDIQPHIYHPLPRSLLKDLKDHPKPVQSKEERLRTILSNLDSHHNVVRQRLIAVAKANHLALKHHEQQQDQSPPTDVDPMDLSDGPSPSQEQALALMHANLSAPYIEGSGDPYTALPAPPPGITQAKPPLEIEITKEALDQIELYDKHARPTKEYYERALVRLRQGRRMSSSGGGDVRKPPGPQRTFSGNSAGPAIASPVDPRTARWR